MSIVLTTCFNRGMTVVVFLQGFPGQQYGPGMGAGSPYPGQPMQYHPGPQRSAPSPSYPTHRMPLQQPNMGQYPAGPGNPSQYYKVQRSSVLLLIHSVSI